MAFMGFQHKGRLYCSKCSPSRGKEVSDLETDKPMNCVTCRAPLETELTGEATIFIYQQVTELLTQGPNQWNLISWFPSVHPQFRTSDVLALMNGIVDDWAVDRLPILADALQDAGYEDTGMLDFLRAPSHEGMVDLCSLSRAIGGNGLDVDHYMYKRRVDLVLDWLGLMDGYMYPGDDDGFGEMVKEMTVWGADVRKLLEGFIADPQAQTNFLDWQDLLMEWGEVNV